MKLHVSVVKFTQGYTELYSIGYKALLICEYDTFVITNVINKKSTRTRKVKTKLCLSLTTQAIYHEDIIALSTRWR
jgi:hypothetical protein